MRLLKTEQDLIESDSLRKQQIMELGLLRDDEKTKLSRSNELELENIKHRYEQDLASYKKQFKDENERLREELKATQKQCDERCRRLNEKIVDLEESLKHSHMESKKLRECLDKEKNERYSTVEAEKASVKKYYSSQLNVSHILVNIRMKWNPLIKFKQTKEIRKRFTSRKVKV